jgi:alpha-L-arabinofuranosidase
VSQVRPVRFDQSIQRIMNFRSFVLSGFFLCVAAMGKAESVTDAPELITVARAFDGGTVISPYLLGAQYTFFASPVKKLLNAPAVVKSWTDLPVKMLRFPGGTWADHYIWDRPENSYFVAGATAKSVVNVDEFLDNARKIGAEPIIQVSANSKGGHVGNLNPTKLEDYKAAAKWAAGWVYDINIKKKRGVKYWEIGNEVWIWFKPEEYARLMVEYSKAMKQVDPSIKILACGLSSQVGPYSATWLNFSETDPDWKPRKDLINKADEWTQALLTIAKDHVDYIAPHPYLSASKDNRDARSKYRATTAKIDASTGLRGQQDYIRKSGSKVRLALTEWVTNFGDSVPGSNSWSKDLYFYTHGNGINAGYYFGRILEGADVTDIAVIHSLEDIELLWYWPRKELASGAPVFHPIYKAMQLWGANLGTRALLRKNEQTPQLTLDGKSSPATFTYASEDKTHVYFVAINLDPDAAHEVQLKFVDAIKVQARARLMVLSAPSISANNFDSWEGEKKPESAITTTEATRNAQGVWTLSLPAASMAALKISK